MAASVSLSTALMASSSTRIARLPFVLPHRAKHSSPDDEDGTLAVMLFNGPKELVNTFREEITIALKLGGELCIAHR